MLHVQEILSLKKRLNEIYVRHTGQSLKKIEDALERDYFLTADMARDFGLVDQVISKRSEAASAEGQSKVALPGKPPLLQADPTAALVKRPTGLSAFLPGMKF